MDFSLVNKKIRDTRRNIQAMPFNAFNLIKNTDIGGGGGIDKIKARWMEGTGS